MQQVSADEFFAIELRVGRIISARPFPEARKPAYKLAIDFGPLGERASSAQITDLYRPEDLVGRLVVAVTNLPARRIAGFSSQVLVLGANDHAGRVVLLAPQRDVAPGTRIH